MRLLLGAGVFMVTGKTPAYAYQSMIRLFCLSSGRSNDLISSALKVLRPKYKLESAKGVLGELTKSQLARISDDIGERGYYVFPERLPDFVCDRLLDYALKAECIAHPLDSDPAGSLPRRIGQYERESPSAVRYYFTAQAMLENSDVQQLMADSSMLAVAQTYLECQPILDVMSMWWHTAYSAYPDKSAAQLYHFDMDRIKWLKYFIYLTDVGPDNGPHCFIEGSHRTKCIPSFLLSKGFSRLSDKEVAQHYTNSQMIQFLAPRGTIIAEDSRGLHKALEVHRGDRLMLQLQFSNSLFGAKFAPAKFQRPLSNRLEKMFEQYPRAYCAYAPKLRS